MVDPNRQPKPEDTEKALRDALDEQAEYFKGVPDPLPAETDEAFWQANSKVLKAFRDHEASKRDDEPPE